MDEMQLHSYKKLLTWSFFFVRLSNYIDSNSFCASTSEYFGSELDVGRTFKAHNPILSQDLFRAAHLFMAITYFLFP